MNNREIKFRVWDGKKIIYTDAPRRVMNDSGGHPYLPFYLHQHTFDNKNIVIEQFTGLKDSKGKDIYRGDILKASYEARYKGDEPIKIQATVHFHHSYWAVGGYKMFIFDDDKLEVIGNIHENPELLK